MALRSHHVRYLPNVGLGRIAVYFFSADYDYALSHLPPLRRTTLRCGARDPARRCFFITALWHSSTDDHVSPRRDLHRNAHALCVRRAKPSLVVDGSVDGAVGESSRGLRVGTCTHWSLYRQPRVGS